MNNQLERTPTGPDDWDRLIDNPFNIGPFDRSMKADDWWVITGMHVRLPDDLVNRPAGTSKLLVFADTISVGISGATQIKVNDLSDVLLIGASVNRYNGCTFHRDMPQGVRTDEFRIALFGKTSEHFPPSEGRWLVTTPGFPEPMKFDLGDGLQPVRTEFAMRLVERNSPLLPRELNRIHSLIPLVDTRQSPLPDSGPGFDACLSFLARILLTAQFLFDEQSPEEAEHLLDRLETLLAINPDVVSWQRLAVQCAVTREMLQPQLPGPNRVPTLSPAVYGNVAKSYGPALKAFADAFQQFVDRTFDIEQRRQAANLMLRKEDNAIKFQALVTEQLEGNLKAANENLSRAETAMEAQSRRVAEAEQAFQEGLKAWRDEQRRQADWAIAGAVFSAVTSFAMIAAGKPTDLSGLAKQAAKAGMLAVKIVKTVQSIEKIIRAITRLVKMIRELISESNKITNAGRFAAQMADARRLAESDLDGAPSESAYWEQFLVEIEAALAPAIDAGIPGAGEYLTRLKVLIIYGRELTSTQAAILPIAQELAQANLLSKLAEDQREAIAGQIRTLRSGPAPAAMAASLWLRHRSVRRAVFTSLQDFDAAYRYWALKEPLSKHTPSHSITDLVSELISIANLEQSFQRALESFDPEPQDFNEDFEVPAGAVADFLRDGSFALHFTPGYGPVEDMGKVGRVRVTEVKVWVIWKEGMRPEGKLMEFSVRTNGESCDRRVESGVVESFRFILNRRVNRTFRYDPARAENDPQAIRTPARVTREFEDYYTQPTLFTEWQFSLPNGGGPRTINREDLQGAVEGIRLEFSGTCIKDPDRFF